MKDGQKKVYICTAKQIDALCDGSSYAKATLAKLRRGVGKPPSSLPELWEVTLGALPDELRGKNEPSYAEWALHTALTLYSVHRQGNELSGKDGDTFGAAARKLKDGNNDDAVKRRFDAVATASNFSELAHYARGLVQLMRTKNIDMDYPAFAADLFTYQFDSRRNGVRLKWGRDFYAYTNAKEGEENESK
jgi:CRISPR system Cascade subunit CasB